MILNNLFLEGAFTIELEKYVDDMVDHRYERESMTADDIDEWDSVIDADVT